MDISDLRRRCDLLAALDSDLASIITNYGYPPFWSRPNSFESLVHIILEQQVSLASALAALDKLRALVGKVTPENISELDETQLKACFFSRQKSRYTTLLAAELISGTLDLHKLTAMTDEEVRKRITGLVGFGDWSADIYLIMVLHSPDVFPNGDLAAVNALRRLKRLPADMPKERVLELTGAWRPQRTAAAMLLWHYYLSRPR